MNKKEELQIIYQRYLQNSATKRELAELMELLKTCDEADMKSEILKVMDQHRDIEISEELEEQLKMARMQLIVKIRDTSIVPMGKRHTWLYAAACAAALIVTGTWFGIGKYGRPHDLAPGRYSAMLLVDGNSKFDPEVLGNGKTATVNGVTVTKQANGNISFSAKETDTASVNHINTITTPNGGQYRVTLSDSTVVMLNSGSSLEFPLAFTGGRRMVKLKGEAYFEVTKNKHKPFIVSTGGQNVQVLGTKFDITNFGEDGGPVTTLAEGSVSVSASTARVMLKPGQQSKLSKGVLLVTDIDAEQFSAWKDGNFDFENASLSYVMHKLSRWYDFETDYGRLPAHNFYIRISRNSNLSDVLHMMTLSSGIKFKIDGRRVTVMQ